MEELIKITKSKGVKATPALLSILELFNNNKFPLNAEFIINNINSNKKVLKGINETTVYRILDKLEDKDILRRVDLRKDSFYFELTYKHHHHIICLKCNTVEDFENKEVEKSIKKIVEKSSKFRKINEHSFELFGICRKCN